MPGADQIRDAQNKARAALDPARNGRSPGSNEITLDGKGKLVLPPVPAHDDLVGLCQWLTAAFSCHPARPITGAAHQGRRGAEGHVVVTRADAPPIRFEPAARINAPGKLIETLSWQLLPTDPAVHALTAAHCRVIAQAIRMLCGATESATDEQETAAIIGTFAQTAVAVEGHTTYGSSSQRYEAGAAMQRALDEQTGRAVGAPRYLIDRETGELVIRVDDLAEAARRHEGTSLPRGWLDGRMEGLGWTRIHLDAHATPGRAGRTGPHLRAGAYRGLLPRADDD